MTITGKTFERCEQGFGASAIARRELIVRPLAGEQRPSSTDTLAIEWLPVLMLAVPIVIIAVPTRSCR